ncbi:fibrinogen gamma-B chain-like [Mytilus trossulus]|uniref:fibrinogen gamma-B chain-like n=1 Tax=Mytilus trossulus TaxID=6551 RepID=UPI003006536D
MHVMKDYILFFVNAIIILLLVIYVNHTDRLIMKIKEDFGKSHDFKAYVERAHCELVSEGIIAIPGTRFHANHGEYINLLDENTVAFHRHWDGSAYTFSEKKLQPGEIFLFEIEKNDHDYSAGLTVGLAQLNPCDKFKLPSYMYSSDYVHNFGRFWLRYVSFTESNKPYQSVLGNDPHVVHTPMGSFNRSLLSNGKWNSQNNIGDSVSQPVGVGSRIGIMYNIVENSAEMHLIINGEDQGPRVRNIPYTNGSLHVMLDVYAKTQQVRIIQLYGGTDKVRTEVENKMKVLEEKLHKITDPAFSLDKPIDCTGIDVNHGSGVYTIYPKGIGSLRVYCDLETNNTGGGWTVFQHRENGDEDFYRKWTDYEKGFGNLQREFWLGNSKINAITAQGRYELMVLIQAFDSSKAHARYDHFKIGDATSNYTLYVGKYSGTAGNSLETNCHEQFTTKDVSQCAEREEAAWWFNECNICTLSNLNGKYLTRKHKSYGGIYWFTWKNSSTLLLKSTTMMMRSVK